MARNSTIFLVAFFILCFSNLALARDNEEALKFAVFPNMTPKQMFSLYTPLVNMLSDKVGRPVTLVNVPDRQAFTRRAMAGEYDLALACVSCYFKIHDKAGYRAVVRGEPSSQGVVVVRKDSQFQKPGQLAGKKIAMAPGHSFAGNIFFKSYLLEHNLEASYAVNTVDDNTIYSVLNRKNDAGVLRLNALDNFPQLKKQLRIIHRSVHIPHFPFIVSPDLGPELVEQIVQTLVNISAADPYGRKLLTACKVQRFEAVADSDYEEFRQVYYKVKKQMAASK